MRTELDEDALPDNTDSFDEDPTARKKGRRWEDRQEVSTIPIVQQRVPHTTTTSLWANGDKGPLVMVFG